ncbi:alpha/beta fold hydrolase [Nocardioides sp. GXQ0305]|uniref:alpha/beta fold hydrolase n=1 Tax=Nocardioides sp. GXQ0305 TaxID=3423912 RepID=UPI003D7D26B0
MSVRGRNRALGWFVATACLLGLLAGVGRTADASPAPGRQSGPTAVEGRVEVGDLTLRPCRVVARALCGSVRRRWDPDDPSAGRVRVGFAFVPARQGPATGTLVAREGGPGYATTASGTSYVRMYDGLMRRRNLLLLDQRGTGRSEPIDCPGMQDLRTRFAVAAGRCGRTLGDLADDYSTERSADDLAAVIERLGLDGVDLYGDSYGTFFAQVFAGRHPDLVRSVVLDAAYPTYGETGWYPTSPPTMRTAFDLACSRSPACRREGAPFLTTLERVLDRVREEPWRGWSHDADGRRMRVRVSPRNLVSVAFAATYTPSFYREMTAAMRNALRGDRAPLLRLVAEAVGGGTDSGAARFYSGGLEAAVSCHDYPTVYPMTLPPGKAREDALEQALRRRTRRAPDTFAPFTVREYARSAWQGLDWCTRWPTAPASNPAGPVRPPGGAYPDVPVLVLVGELDSITTPAEGLMVVDQFPDATMVEVRNSFHVTAIGDTDDCAVRIMRAFVREPETQPDADRRACAEQVEPIRTPGVFPVRLADVRAARGDAALRVRRAGAAAADTVVDLFDRWWNNYSGHGVGLRGGTWTYRGGRVVRFRLDGVRQVRDLAVSGTAVWDRYAERVRVELTLAGAVTGRLRGGWDTREWGAEAGLRGRIGGRPVRLRLPAP